MDQHGAAEAEDEAAAGEHQEGEVVLVIGEEEVQGEVVQEEVEAEVVIPISQGLVVAFADVDHESTSQALRREDVHCTGGNTQDLRKIHSVDNHLCCQLPSQAFVVAHALSLVFSRFLTPFA